MSDRIEPTDQQTDQPTGDATGELAAATAQLRRQPATLPVEVADRVVRRALRERRPAGLVRSVDPDEHLRVSTTVLVALLRHRLDGGLDHAAVRRVRCETGRGETLESVTVELIVGYGHDVRVAAGRARVLVEEVLTGALGPADGTRPGAHVHVGEVTLGDPHLVEPSDEAGWAGPTVGPPR